MMHEERAANEAPTDDGQDQNYDVLAATTSHETAEGESEHPFGLPGGSTGRIADVNPDGTVRDWRRPDTTPDRGPDVGTTVHQVGEDGPRFSGGGAQDDEDDDLYPIPTALSFGDRELKEAADIRQIMYDLINETEDFPHLRGRELDAVWVKAGGSTSQEATLYVVRPPGKYERRSTRAVMMIAMSADHLRSMRADRDTVTALVHEGLCAIARSKKGKLYVSRPDFHGYTKNVARFGALLPKVKAGAVALAQEIRDVRNQRLPFDEPQDDGAGVLIYADGTALTDGEIEAMERHELNDDPYEQAVYGEPDTSGELPTGEEIDAARAERGEPDILLDDPAAI